MIRRAVILAVAGSATVAVLAGCGNTSRLVGSESEPTATESTVDWQAVEAE